ncbi:hypothetical protein AHMF7605_05195 [Adhaeribacter arboris]|uniref:Lipoprotein n=1 Tax=Adhaeribacter arboris TaxID=2072846 RepID=A0A2T2YBU1_9BACT|nr:hypothetical protein [Adhaeribacter arboris]PSR52963.1 hypothetical protein AHMF7605_05195 [Adhaeribacter arboris]
MKKKLYVFLLSLAIVGVGCQGKDHRTPPEGYGAGQIESNNADNPNDGTNTSMESPVNIKPDSGITGMDSANMAKKPGQTSAEDPDAAKATSVTENNAGNSETRGKENNSPSRQMPQTNKPQNKKQQ